jgi:hypothetical protein
VLKDHQIQDCSLSIKIWCSSITYECILTTKTKKKLTPLPESASELYRPSDLRLPANLVPTFADRRCHVVNTTDPYGRILDFLVQIVTRNEVRILVMFRSKVLPPSSRQKSTFPRREKAVHSVT